jgi:hypothetical protein
MEGIPVLCSRVQSLHAGLDDTENSEFLIEVEERKKKSSERKRERENHSLERHRRIHRNQSCNSANPKRYSTRQWLAWPGGALHKLFEGHVCRKPDGRVRSLTHHLEGKHGEEGKGGDRGEQQKVLEQKCSS